MNLFLLNTEYITIINLIVLANIYLNNIELLNDDSFKIIYIYNNHKIILRYSS